MVNLDSDMLGALTRGEFVAFFQPQFDLATGRLIAVESLSRWRHPIRGIVMPHEYIPEAERSGFICELGAFMLAEGCRCAARWAAAGTSVEVAVNVSAVQLAFDPFAGEVISALEGASLAPQLLTLEVTESRAILDLDVAVRGLETLRQLGVSVSIDDYGTGFSSLGQVESLPSTELKIDKSLVQSEAPGAAESIRSIVKFAHDLGLRVVAEGIETSAQYDRVRECGCDRGQGFLLGHPLPESEMDELLASHPVWQPS